MTAWIARLLTVVALIWMALPASAEKGDREAEYGAIASAIGIILNGPDRLPLPIEQVRRALTAHYSDNGGTVYWAGTGRMTPFLQRLKNAEADGLNPDDYPIESLTEIRDTLDESAPERAAEAELFFSAFYIAYAADLKIGRVAPQKVDRQLFRSRKTIDALRVLTDMNKQRDPSKFLNAFEPRNPHYVALKQALKVYRAMADVGGWGKVDPGPDLKPGASSPRVAQARRILAATGDFDWEGSGNSYDEQLAIAVKRFQSRHGIEANGKIGKQTQAALNMSAEERVRQIMLNMERWRWMPDNLGDYHFLVNIAAYQLQRVETNTIVERMDVVAGAVATQTPEFSDEMEYIEFNPTWTVPYSIATKEMLPRLRGDRNAYAGEFEVFRSGVLASWGGIDWSSVGPGKFPFTFRQKPGPKNALGKVKFMLPNKHNIYLHDTPAKDKFSATTRAFSHGCIRLSKPVELAYTVGRENAGWSEQKTAAAFKSGKTTRAILQRKIPVHLIYATSFKGDAGVIEFRPDVYGRDRKLYNALFGKPSS
jgi:L,D-transpeptidase YcbB